MIRCHQRNRFRLQVTLAIEYAAVEHHLRKARVVRRGPDHPRTAGLPAPHPHRITNAGDWTGEAIVRKRLGDQRPLGLVCDIERGLAHPKRIEQALSLELKQ